MMSLSSSEPEVEGTHAWMITGHRDTGDTQRSGWPRVVFRPTPPDEHNPSDCPLSRNSRHHAHVFLDPGELRHDASWCPKSRRCGAAVAVFYSNTLWF